ncbi:MAG: DNA ligase [Gammaproteobacteria bacterium]|nr:DNA ligase [Gammaproteobacteria bacterium]
MHSLFLAILFLISCCSSANQPDLLLANTYHKDIQLQDYWVSEKLDGVRAYWNGKNLISRQGIVFNAPKWFTKPLPHIALDGELWLARGQFEKLSGLVQRQTNTNKNWKPVKYMIFDLPNSDLTFSKRIKQMEKIIDKTNVSHLQMIQQYKVKNHQLLSQKLDDIVSKGGEGLMLHRGESLYEAGRNNDLLKLKKHQDAEAIVIKHLPGKGKFKNMMGALLVETEDRIRFKIGTGFSLQQRKNPPPIGTQITYKYFGLTNNGNPRFASFMRIRE